MQQTRREHCLLRIFQHAAEVPLAWNDVFIESALLEVADACGLQSALFGIRRISDGLSMKASIFINLDPCLIDAIHDVPYKPSLAHKAYTHLGHAVTDNIFSNNLRENKSVRELFGDYGLPYGISFVSKLSSQYVAFVTGYQQKESFSSSAVELFEHLADNLVRVVIMRGRLFENTHTHGSWGGAFSLSRDGGRLNYADCYSLDMLSREWPGWKGGSIHQLNRLAREQDSRFVGNTVCIQKTDSPSGTYFVVRPRLPFDDLTSREVSVAQCYSWGMSCKEIAKQLSLSPATVKTHLSHIFAKLNIRNKAALAHAMENVDFRHSGDCQQHFQSVTG